MDSPTVFVSSRELTLSSLLSLEGNNFQRDWHGNKLRFSLCAIVAIDPSKVFFLARGNLAADYDRQLLPGQFVEELWRRDVVELFISDDTSEAYQEINLSPAGAWWTARFVNYRKQDQSFKPSANLEVLCSDEGNFWTAGLALARSSLAVNCQFSANSRVNLAAIINKDGSRRLLSIANDGSAKPDFHCRYYYPLIDRQLI